LWRNLGWKKYQVVFVIIFLPECIQLAYNQRRTLAVASELVLCQTLNDHKLCFGVSSVWVSRGIRFSPLLSHY